MVFQVSDSAINNAAKCSYDFRCVNHGGMPACPVDRKIEKNGLFVNSTQNHECNYKLSFGTRYICHCPVRIEIYDCYGK
ncbi:MAG: hypothetical protein R6U89_03205 [Dehalococcoidia bacterium]